MLAGWVLASSVCASKHAGWVIVVVSMSPDATVPSSQPVQNIWGFAIGWTKCEWGGVDTFEW